MMLKRSELVRLMNEQIAQAPTPELRVSLGEAFKTVLLRVKAGAYQGYSYADWLNGGHAQWVKDGRPEDKTPYLGDQSKIVLF